jgi:hypothetical protein
MLLDIVEVAKSHSGANLVGAFANILNEFDISKKVSILYRDLPKNTYAYQTAQGFEHHMRQCVMQQHNDRQAG